ncbi:16S rRNA (guanine(966)-N(2))-methyltransferase RsmD [uncultured Rothia sp.]|mgnify:FL=1|uniref:16S rRNA (guanine(966)-N(2))-methyltransferase RsmD n=1 Tax=uncultured Rothia sp. TaxID=316088 RepID=UPI00321685CC
MSRIIAGAAGGLRLENVPGSNTRPTTDRVKEALFSRLETYDILVGSRVLDLFGGSGALGYESISRGAAHADFCETYAKAQNVLEKNAHALAAALPGRIAKIHKMSARSFLTHYAGKSWELVFIDPPYAMDNEELEELLTLLAPHLAEGAVVVIERSSRTAEPAWPYLLSKFAEKKYGETILYFVEPEAQDSPVGLETGTSSQ